MTFGVVMLLERNITLCKDVQILSSAQTNLEVETGSINLHRKSGTTETSVKQVHTVNLVLCKFCPISFFFGIC